MGAITRVHALGWTTELLEGGYTCWTLAEPSGRRWGWVINAARPGWLAHVGDWGQARDLGLPTAPGYDDLEQQAPPAAGRSGVEETLARQWASKPEPADATGS